MYKFFLCFIENVNIVRYSLQFWYWKCGFVSNLRLRSIEKCFTNINHQICRWIITNKQQQQQQQTIQIQFCCYISQLFCLESRLAVIHLQIQMESEKECKVIQMENDYPFNNDSFPIYETKRNSRILNAGIHWLAYVSFSYIKQESKLNHTIFSNEMKKKKKTTESFICSFCNWKDIMDWKRWQ